MKLKAISTDFENITLSIVDEAWKNTYVKWTN
jgi:hypothetical protein